MSFRRNIEIESDGSEARPLFSQPYICSVNAEDEYVVLYNPRDTYFDLDGYSIADGKIHHTFRFPSRCRIPPRSEYYIYTCPGADQFDHGTLFEYHVLWTNLDGTLRRMEVLNNDKCSVKLLSPTRRVLSVCTAGEANPLTAERLKYEAQQQSFMHRIAVQVNFLLCYLRVILLFIMSMLAVSAVTFDYNNDSDYNWFSFLTTNDSTGPVRAVLLFVLLYWATFALDMLSRLKGQYTGGKDPIPAGISLFADRLTSIVLGGAVWLVLCREHFLLLVAAATAGSSSNIPTDTTATSGGSMMAMTMITPAAVQVGGIHVQMGVDQQGGEEAEATMMSWILPTINSCLGLNAYILLTAILTELLAFFAYSMYVSKQQTGSATQPQQQQMQQQSTSVGSSSSSSSNARAASATTPGSGGGGATRRGGRSVGASSSGSSSSSSSRGFIQPKEAVSRSDVYAWIARIHPALLTVTCMGSEFYMLHCFTSYFHQYLWNPRDILSTAWVVITHLSCCAYYIRLLNHIVVFLGTVGVLLIS
mmetsp:Transcript_495/g.875  ORF Transcript_495/g.875 Transcript_495/m.875 type:complete len:532 (-) Transcript_495:39-1634(-)